MLTNPRPCAIPKGLRKKGEWRNETQNSSGLHPCQPIRCDDLKRCAQRIFEPNGYYSSQCSRRGILEHDGKLWCKQHHPPTAEAKDAERRKRRDEKWAEQDRKLAASKAAWDELRRKAEAYDRLVAALGRVESMLTKREIRAILEGK